MRALVVSKLDEVSYPKFERKEQSLWIWKTELDCFARAESVLLLCRQFLPHILTVPGSMTTSMIALGATTTHLIPHNYHCCSRPLVGHHSDCWSPWVQVTNMLWAYAKLRAAGDSNGGFLDVKRKRSRSR